MTRSPDRPITRWVGGTPLCHPGSKGVTTRHPGVIFHPQQAKIRLPPRHANDALCGKPGLTGDLGNPTVDVPTSGSYSVVKERKSNQITSLLRQGDQLFSTVVWRQSCGADRINVVATRPWSREVAPSASCDNIEEQLVARVASREEGVANRQLQR